MTDYTHMTKDEMVLRLNIETALKKCYESECTKLEKELEVLEEKFVTLNDKYRELEKEKANVEIETKLKLNNNLTLLKGANANASALSLENEKLKKQIGEQQNELYSQGKKIDSLEHENMKLKAEYGELLTCHNDFKHELDICTKEIKRLREKVENQRIQLNGVQQALLNRNMTIEALTGENDRLKKEVKETRVVFEPTSCLIDIQTKDEEIRTLRKKNLDLKNENEGWKLKYDHLADVRDARIRELKAMTNDYYGILNKYDDLSKDYHELKKQKEDLDADIAKKILDNIELNEQIEKDIQDYNKLFHEKEKLEKDLEDANKRATPPTQPINIENLNVTYYANGPIWTNEEDDDVE